MVSRLRQRPRSMRQSAQSTDEVFGPQVRVTLEHPKLLVPGNRRYLCYVEALLEQAADALVSKIVEAEIVHLSTDTKMLEGKADRVTSDRKNPIGVPTLVRPSGP